ncbi:Uncharacterized protein M6B38_249025 [Iris pallida]|uniref:noroxomaritidine synthase n=1 Tax=Iris pallida TaxID=29817 RepID=A0AAX6DFI7_IRIPA|nr:Uncharacterized protein M6B38_249025 [Iris pallida]
MEVEEGLMEVVQVKLSILFFSFTLSFLSFSLLLFFLRSKHAWCNCHVCKSYLNSSWTADFDNLVDWYSHLLLRSPTQTIHIHVLDNIVTANPDNVEYMLKTNFDNFPKGKAFSSILGDLLGDGIFNADGELWNFQRKMASLELGSTSVRSNAFDIVSSEVRSRLFPLLDSISSSCGTIDLQDIFRRFSFDTICKISFGLDPGCLDLLLPISEFAAAFDLATSLSARRAIATSPIVWKVKRLLNWGSERELRKAIELVDVLAAEVIRQRRKLGFSSKDDLLSRFMGSVSDDKYLRDIVISFLLAGRDTVASGLTVFFFLLSNHPEVVGKMREEIDRVVGNNIGGGGDQAVPSYENLRRMNYVHAALYECLRLYPPVQFDSKFCVDDDVLADGTFAKKGTRVTYHPYAMGRMDTIWGSDCSSFRPERWLRSHDGSFVPKNPFEFPVFQGGTRVCLGKEMSLMEMKTVVVSVIRRFDVEVGSTRLPKFAPGLTATLGGGLSTRVRRRGRSSEGYHC